MMRKAKCERGFMSQRAWAHAAHCAGETMDTNASPDRPQPGLGANDGHGRRRKCRSVPSLAHHNYGTRYSAVYARGPFFFGFGFTRAFMLGNMKHAASLLFWCNYVQKRASRIQETRQDLTHPHSVVSQEDEWNRSKSGSSSQRPLG
jgi:hypothetical protein